MFKMKFGEVLETLVCIKEAIQANDKCGLYSYSQYGKKIDLPESIYQFLIQRNLIEVKNPEDLSQELDLSTEEIRDAKKTFDHCHDKINCLSSEISHLEQKLYSKSRFFSKRNNPRQEETMTRLKEKKEEYNKLNMRIGKLRGLLYFALTQDGSYVRFSPNSFAETLMRDLDSKRRSFERTMEALSTTELMRITGEVDFDVICKNWNAFVFQDIKDLNNTLECIANNSGTPLIEVLDTYLEFHTKFKHRTAYINSKNLGGMLKEAHENRKLYGGFDIDEIKIEDYYRIGPQVIKPPLIREKTLEILAQGNSEDSLTLLRKLSGHSLQYLNLKENAKKIYENAIEQISQQEHKVAEGPNDLESKQAIYEYWKKIDQYIEYLTNQKTKYKKVLKLKWEAEQRGIESQLIEKIRESLLEEQTTFLEKLEQIGKKWGIPDITPAMITYFGANNLGALRINIPHAPCEELSLKLENLIKHLNLSDTESICVYGSSLYRNFTTKRENRWLFFWPKRIKERNKKPNDFDVMVITKETPKLEQMIIQSEINLNEITEYSFYHGGYYTWHELIVGEVPVTFKIRGKWFGEIKEIADYFSSLKKRAAGLHIIYRSLDQFLSGPGKGDELSESVVRYGIPIIGIERFNQIVQTIQYPERKPLHDIKWYISRGKLNGEIV